MFSPHALGGRLDRYHDLSVRSGKHPLQGRSSLPVDISAMKTSTWTYKPAQLLAMPPPAAAGGEKQLRFRPEKAHRRPVQRLQWRRSVWSTQQDDAGYLDLNRVSSMTIADVSPKFAVKRIVMLHENLQYREAANFINRLSHGTFKVILCDLPVEVFIDSMPNSLPVLESLYAKVFLSDGLDFSLKTLKPEAVVMQMVKFFAQHEENAPGNLKLEGSAPFAVSCKKLLKVIVHTDPKIKKMLLCRRKSVEKAIEGMGHHGMVGNADGSLMNLHDALKLEFQRVVSSYKAALETLEELSLSTNGSKQTLSRSISHGPAPIQVSHQRQLSITQQEIQDRLIKNKTVLNVVEPILGSHSLDVFLGILQRRIEHDKDCLFQFTQLKKEVKDIGEVNVVAPVLMRYRHGIEQVLKLMREVTGDQEESEGSDISGYHSDSDSAIMTSGNSPYVSKSARYNFLYRSVRATPTQFRGPLPSFSLPPASLSGTSAPSSEAPSEGGKSSDQVSTNSPIDNGSRARKRTDLGTNSNNSCGASTSSENEVTCPKGHTLPLMAPPCGQKRNYESGVAATLVASVGSRNKQTASRSRKQDDTTPRPELTRRNDSTACDDLPPEVVVDNITHISIDNQSAALVNRYAQLHMQDRSQALQALDALPELRNSDELKSKLLFSVVVLAFRSVSCTQQQVRETVRRQLQIPPPPPDRPLPPGRPQDSQLQRSSQLEITLNRFLQQTVDTYDLSSSVEDVCRQIWATLYDYPSLRSSEGLLSYIKECVRLAWALINQTTPCRIEYEQRTFSGQLHVRHQCSDAGQSTVLSYLWPALIEQGTGCVYKAVVIT